MSVLIIELCVCAGSLMDFVVDVCVVACHTGRISGVHAVGDYFVVCMYFIFRHTHTYIHTLLNNLFT